MKIKNTSLGVSENTYHCFVLEFLKDNVQIYETFDYKVSKGELKAIINMFQWNNIKDIIINRIDTFIKDNNYKKNRFSKSTNYLNIMLGKEITFLFWGIEDAQEKNKIESALRNWQGLTDAERWYFYTMTNANLSKEHSRGWRGAVKKILIEN